MAYAASFYLSANSGQGLRDLSGGLELYDLLLLPPGPGGRAFLRCLLPILEASGGPLERFPDPTDPDALQGVLLPDIRCAVLISGRAPRYPGAVERTVFVPLDVAALKADREELIQRTNRASAAEARAYHLLSAAQQIARDAVARRSANLEKLQRRFAGIMARELPRRGSGGEGRVSYRFLSSVTPAGYAGCFRTAEALCPKVYVLEDRYHLAAPCLERFRAAACARGWDAVACPSSEEPSRLEHLLLPELGVALVTSAPELAYPGKPYRRIRVDATVEGEDRGKLRLEARLAGELRQEAVDALREALEERRKLEGIQAAAMDLDAVRLTAVVEASRLLAWREAAIRAGSSD